MTDIIVGSAYVVGDDVDTDQIIPGDYLTYSMNDPEGAANYGKYALSGLPNAPTPFVSHGTQSGFSIIVSGMNFGCGSSREQAPFALQAAGVKAVIAQSYARIFYRNVVDAARFMPFQLASADSEWVKTGDRLEIDEDAGFVRNITTGQEALLVPLGDAGDIIKSGGLFNYANTKDH